MEDDTIERGRQRASKSWDVSEAPFIDVLEKKETKRGGVRGKIKKNGSILALSTHQPKT